MKLSYEIVFMSLVTGRSIVSPSLVRITPPRISLFTHVIITRKIAETIIDKTIEVNAIGGVYGNNKPTEFMCLLLKLLQIQPEKEILLEYLQADEFK